MSNFALTNAHLLAEVRTRLRIWGSGVRILRARQHLATTYRAKIIGFLRPLQGKALG